MVNKPDFINNLDFELLKKKYTEDAELERVIEKIKNDYPVQYAIGDVEFLDQRILVDERALIPRFETEILVSELIRYIESFSLEKGNMLDLCTGSGCIAVSLKKKFPYGRVTALDKSEDALTLARENAELNQADITFLHGDVLLGINLNDRYDVLVSNPPYVARGEKVTPNTRFEPEMALYPGEDEIIFYKRILDESPKIMKKRCIIAFEIGSKQANDIVFYAKKIYPDSKISVLKDYAGFDRFVFIFNNIE